MQLNFTYFMFFVNALNLSENRYYTGFDDLKASYIKEVQATAI